MPGPPAGQSFDALWPNLLLFFGFYAVLVVMLGLWSRVLARRAGTGTFHRSLRRFNQAMFVARLMVPTWFMLGVWNLGWGSLVAGLGQPVYRSVVGLLLGTFPAFATWMGLWWSQYPAERAMREQNLLIDLDNDVPLYQPLRFRHYFLSNLRLQVLFTLLPVVMIVIVRDALGWLASGVMERLGISGQATAVEMGSLVVAAGSVYLFAPALLRRILSTTPMPDSPLLRRLDALCKRTGVRYRLILVWNTHHHVGNAAVMGLLPWLRYILLSDVLLEQMSEEEIEAVFAHELGHIVHRHMTWYAIFFVMLMLAMGAIGGLLDPWFHSVSETTATGIASAMFMTLFLLLFGALSRRCERQADVYAARTMEMLKAEEPLTSEGLFDSRQLATLGAGPLIPPRAAGQTPVGRHGARLFASALRRVATINNIPVVPRPAAVQAL